VPPEFLCCINHFGTQKNILMKKILFAASLLLSMSACNIMKYSSGGELTRTNFKTTLPFTVEKEMAIVVPIAFSGDTAHYRFHFDTHAPESAYEESGRLSGKQLHYLGASSIKIQTTSGEQFSRQYYRADSVYLGDVAIAGPSFIKMPGSNKAADTSYPQFDGILGMSLLRNGVWKIDFETMQLCFTNSIDSLGNTQDKILFAGSNLFDVFQANVQLDGLEKKVSVDFGANMGMMLSLEDMKQLTHFKQATQKTGTQKTAAGVSAITTYRLPAEQVKIGDQAFTVKVVGSERQSTAVIGLDFFRQFRYVIIDYPKGKLYVARRGEQVAAKQ
jgi:hypothetical protein